MKLSFREPGLPASVALHGAVLLAGIINFSSPKPFADAQEAISVEVIDESALREVTKGERQAKPQPVPAPRVERVDDRKEQNAPGEAKRQVNADATPKPQEATAREERKETTAAVTPPPLPAVPRIVPAAPPKPEPPKPADTPKPVAAKPPKPAESTDEEEEEAEEVIRQAARKKAEEQKKLEDQRRADERRKTEEARRQEVAKQEAAKQEQARQEQARQEQAKQEQTRQEQTRQEQARAQAEARQREEQKRLADAKAAQEKAAQDQKAADDRKKAEDARKAQEAARKAAEDRRKREAEQEARNQATAEAARRALLASREAPANSGNTGQQVSRTPSQGTPTATGQRLNPSERSALVGMIADQIRACWNVPVAGKPSVMPQVRVALNQDGSLASQPTLINSSGDPLFRAVADSGMRAIRQCSPFRIPARFAPMYSDWRSLIVQLNPDD